ncbi:hypothetical protein, partial [Blastomonas sp. CCH5-A3]|uniref:hypothetical protein n=1 Tax=Blastomonas sp. CCH5-A3 TaxID=1768761 RepID=UPI001E51D271
MMIDGSDQRWQLHRQQQLVEEPLLGAFKPAACRSFCAAVERCAADFIDHAGELQRFLHVLMDDRLSRGSGNAKERGVGAG